MLGEIRYDIPDNTRRLKIANLLFDFGAERVQRSVFECHITAAHYRDLCKRLAALLVEEEDNLRLYTLCASCQEKTVLMGAAQPAQEPGLRIL